MGNGSLSAGRAVSLLGRTSLRGLTCPAKSRRSLTISHLPSSWKGLRNLEDAQRKPARKEMALFHAISGSFSLHKIEEFWGTGRLLQDKGAS